jgi:hypothetical protein
MFTIVICDIYLYLIYRSKLVKRPATLSTFAAIARYLTFLSGKEMWVYGFFAIYILLGCFLTFHIARYYLPYRANYKLDDIINLKDPKKTNFCKATSRPEGILFLITVSMLVLMIVLAVTEPVGVPLIDLTFLNERKLSFYSVAFGSVAIVLTFWSWHSLERGVKRNILRCQMREFFVWKIKFTFYDIIFTVCFI